MDRPPSPHKQSVEKTICGPLKPDTPAVRGCIEPGTPSSPPTAEFTRQEGDGFPLTVIKAIGRAMTGKPILEQRPTNPDGTVTICGPTLANPPKEKK